MAAGMADGTTTGPADRPERDSGWQRPRLRSAPAPWEGPLVSDTTDMTTGSSGVPEEPPTASPWPGDAAGRAGTSPEPAGAVRSWPDGDSSAGAARSAGAAGTTAASRRGGTGLSGMLLPDLQRLAQSMGIMGTGRMRKGQVIAAIEERQGSGDAVGDSSGRPEEPVVISVVSLTKGPSPARVPTVRSVAATRCHAPADRPGHLLCYPPSPPPSPGCPAPGRYDLTPCRHARHSVRSPRRSS